MRRGSGLSAAVKACARCPKVAEQDSALISIDLLFLFLENLLEQMASKKALRIWCVSGMVKLLRKKSCWSPTEERKEGHLVKDRLCFSFAPDVVAAAWAFLAAERRAMR